MAGPEPLEIGVRNAEAEGDPVIAAVHDYWRQLAGGGLPARKSFDFMAVYRQAPHLLMAERIDRATFKFIYCGTTVAENFPVDLTGKHFGPETPRVSKVPWPILFNSVLDGTCIRFGAQAIDWPGPKFSLIRFGVFPLSGDDGRARYTLASLVFAGRR